MLSVLEDVNSSKEVASEPFEFEELCSEDFDKVYTYNKYVYTQHSHAGMYCDRSSLVLHTTCEMLVDYVTLLYTFVSCDDNQCTNEFCDNIILIL